MEPLQRRSFDSISPRRPAMGGPHRSPALTAQPGAAARPSALQPPSPHPKPTGGMDFVRPAGVPAHLQPAQSSAATLSQHHRPVVSASHPQAAQQQPSALHPPTHTPHHQPAAHTPPPPHTLAPQQSSVFAPPSPSTSVPSAFAPPRPQQPAAPARHMPAHPAAQPTPRVADALRNPVDTDSEVPHETKIPHETGHAGLIGFIVFVVVGAACFAPGLPGVIWRDAPGSLQNESSGDQSIGCIDELGKTTTTLHYDSKLGFPVTYHYSTTSHISASCDGKTQTAVGGRASQLNPLAVLIDATLTIGLAVITSVAWRKIYRSRH
jgi:hypothetical protein